MRAFCIIAAGAGLLLLVGEPIASLPHGALADRIVVEKSERRLTLFRDGKPLKTYRIALGGNPVGPKRVEGDKRTPEGTYTIDWRKADSQYYRALHISYPGREDVARARAMRRSPGGDIMIHGQPEGPGWRGFVHENVDWTEGCIAVTNREMDELWSAVPDGTRIEIRP